MIMVFFEKMTEAKIEITVTAMDKKIIHAIQLHTRAGIGWKQYFGRIFKRAWRVGNKSTHEPSELAHRTKLLVRKLIVY